MNCGRRYAPGRLAGGLLDTPQDESVLLEDGVSNWHLWSSLNIFQNTIFLMHVPKFYFHFLNWQNRLLGHFSKCQVIALTENEGVELPK